MGSDLYNKLTNYLNEHLGNVRKVRLSLRFPILFPHSPFGFSLLRGVDCQFTYQDLC